VIRVYTAEHCAPCVVFDQELREQIKQGKINEDVEFVDVETDEGFQKFKNEVLSKDDGAVPSAYKEGQQCRIGYDGDHIITFECPSPEYPSELPQE